jgi:tRNA modification GTPase
MQEGLHKILSDEGTIVAISTPLGHSGIGVVRMSGADCHVIGSRCFRPHSKNPELHHRNASVGWWVGLSGEPIDEVVVTFFQGPHSYTGEDMLEVSAHGNPLVLETIVETIRHAGARLASAGEFTLRAVAHGKMDLIQAESVKEFIEVQTTQQARTVLRQMEGALSNRIRPLKTVLVDVIARLEAGIDFAEDDVEIPSNSGIAAELRPVREGLERLDETFQYGKLLSNGLRLAIIGKANVGKSSLFNRLISAERAIVTEIPGTTRDVLAERMDIDGVPISFVDTAGIRETTDVVERIGIAKTFEAVADADFILVVLDGSAAMDEDDTHVLEKSAQTPYAIVVNKIDLPQKLDTDALNGATRVSVSTKTGDGLDHLKSVLRSFLFSRKASLNDDVVLTQVRHHEAVSGTAAVLARAEDALLAGLPHELVLLDLYGALTLLHELTGEVVTDDILGRIFSTFCIGK